MVNLIPIELTINGKRTTLDVAPETNLMKILREQLHLTGTKCGCGEGTCGTCTVILNGKAVRSCVIKPDKLKSANVETIEGLSSDDVLHPIQEAFIERQGSQCGFCTPGMIMSAKALLDKTPKPTEDDIKNALRINICRCTGYEQVIEAVQQAVGILQSGESTNRMMIVGSDEERNWVGKSVPRRDAKELITGTALFTEDIPDPEGTLFLSTKRSEKAHANIRSIDSSKAEKIPGVIRVITAKDIPGENSYGKIVRDIPVLASDKVRSYADAVALVVAESYEIAQLGCEAIKIEYEELPTIFNFDKSLDPDAPKIHPKGNLLYEFDIIKGDVDKGFDECDVIIEEEFNTPRVDHGQMEPEAALAYFDDNMKLCVKAPTQHVFFDRLNIIRALGVPKDDVRVIQPPVGGAFGKREDVYGQIHCALGAFLTKRPVRTVYSREETFGFTQKRHPTRIKIKVGAKKGGQLIAFKADVLSDTGAYASWGQNILRKICVHVSGPYEIPNVRVNGRSVYTNNIFCGAMRGFGTPQAVFSSESALDILAEKLQIDRVELRKINSFKPGSKTATGQVVTNTPGRQTIELAAKHIKWDSDFSKDDTDNNNLKYGRGIASLWYGIGFGAGIPDQGHAIVEITSAGKAKVFVSTVDYGQGSNTIFPQIAAEALGLNISDITMVTGDSDTTPNCGSSVATRQTFITGNAINNACNKIADDIKAIAAIKLNTSFDDIQLNDNIASQRKDPSNKIAVSDIFASFEEYGKPLRREAFFKGEKYTQHLDPKTGQGNAYHPIAYGTQIAEISVDIKTGKVNLEKIVACHYIGKALNPESVRGQILGGISMGWGYALTEDSKDSEGRCLADNFGKYRMMRATDIPEYNVILLEDPEPTGPYGAIGIGEPPTVATAPAIINAIYDAIGVRITSLPATPEKILAALKNKTE
jgi:CO/xanthine dehydrogenase Mo-binding subunit/aerobic-type carbon monoxide dehydrogenase small subunit (CoxS/CutS family)